MGVYFIDFWHRQDCLERLKSLRRERQHLVDSGLSKNEARRRLGRTIHCCEEILALYNEQVRNGILAE